MSYKDGSAWAVTLTDADGIAIAAVEKLTKKRGGGDIDYDIVTSPVDSLIPEGDRVRQDTYALIIGNQNYRFVSDVPYAIHDARVFADYCKTTLGIPIENTIAAGDEQNDISMIEAAGLGIAMINASEEVKAYADVVTKYDNDHDGLAELIRSAI